MKIWYPVAFACTLAHTMAFAQFKAPVSNPFGLGSYGGHAISGSLGDMDNDGDADMFISDLTERRTYYLQNTGTRHVPAFTPATTSLPYAVHNLDVADVDGDGDYDLMGVDVENKRLLYRPNMGSATAYLFTATIQPSAYNPFGIEPPAGSFMKAEFGDANNNGNLDCFVVSVDANAWVYYYERQSQGNATRYAQVGLNPGGLFLPPPLQGAALEIGDGDGDGKPDMWVGLANGDLLFYRSISSDGRISFESAVVNPYLFDPVYTTGKRLKDITIDFVDIDTDGDQDLFVFDGDSGDIVFYESTGSDMLAPDNVVATATSASTIRLTWRDNTRNENGFIIERAAATGEFTVLKHTDANTTSFEDQGLPANATFRYRLRAIGENNASPYSEVATATTWAETLLPPSAPQNLTAQAVDVDAVQLNWTDAASDEEGYLVERAAAAEGPFQSVAALPADAEAFTDESVQQGMRYYYRVSAYRKDLSGHSEVVSVQLPELHRLDIPTLFTPDGDSFNATWNILNLEYYQQHSVKVFDRFGEEVFASNHYGAPGEWDGTSNGKVLPAGVYIYVIELDNGRKTEKGVVTIIRNH